MAKQPHFDGDPTPGPQNPKKNPEDAATPKPAPADAPPIPNMSLDDDEPLVVGEIEEVVPIEEEPMATEAIPVSEDDVLDAEVVEEDAEPVKKAESDVFLADALEDEPIEAVPASDVIELESASEVIRGDEAVLADEVIGAHPMDSPVLKAPPPISGFGKEPRFESAGPPSPKPVVDEQTEMVSDQAARADGAAESAQEKRKAELPATEVAPDAAEPISEMPPSAVEAEEVVVESASGVIFDDDEVVEPMPASAVEMDDEVVEEAAPASAVEAAEEVVEEAAPISAVEAADDVVEEAAPASAVEATEEVVEEAAPISAVEAAEEIEEAAPESGVVFDDDIVEAAPASAVAMDDEVIAEAPPSSVISAVEVVAEDEEVEEAPQSAVEASEEVLDEDVAEAMPASAVAEELLAEDEVSSATRKAESVFEEEVLPAESAASAVPAPAESDILAELMADSGATPASKGKKKPADQPDSGTIFLDELLDAPSSKPAKKKGADLEQTIMFEAPDSDAEEAENLVAEEDLTPTSEGSAVNLGDMPARRGSSVSGIDPVAEALESGVDIKGVGAGKSKGKAPSVEFDELLDDLDGSSETESPIPKGKKGVMEDSTETDAGVFEGAADKSAKSKKKAGKKDSTPAPHTGDDVDISELLDESSGIMGDSAEEALAADEAEEVGEAVEADEDDAISFDDELDAGSAKPKDEDAISFDSETDVAEAAESSSEAAEAFDEEVEAADADSDAEPAEALDEDDMGLLEDDEAPAPKGKAGKKAALLDDDEAEAEDDEDASAKKKKGKKGKTIAPPAPAQPSMALRWLGGMFVATLFLLGGAAAAFWFTPFDTVNKFTEFHPNFKKPAPPEKSKLEKARTEIDNGRFDAVEGLLQNPVGAELAARGEARWLAYFKQQSDKKAPLDRDDPKVKAALKDLADAKSKVLVDQINDTLKAGELDAKLNNLLASDENKKKELANIKADKDKAEAVVKDVKQALVDGKVVPKAEDIDVAALPKTLKDLGLQKGMLDAVNKLLKDNKVEAEGDKGVKEVLDARKKTEEDLAAANKIQEGINKVLEDEKTKEKNAEGVMEIVAARNKAAKDRDDLAATIAAAFKELGDGKANDDPRKQIVEAAKTARKKAESPLAIPLTQLGTAMAGIGVGTATAVERAFDMATVFTELGFYKTREPFIQTPQQKMDTYITLLQNRDQKDPKELAAIKRETDWVLSEDAKADPESRGKALFVQGLAARNQENFDQARTAFDESFKAVRPVAKVGAWSALAKKAQDELTKPFAYYLPRIEKLETEGNWKSALAEANVALKAMPKDASLIAQRGLIRYELVRGQGPKVPAEAQKAIRADADAVAADTKDPKFAAKGAYLQGLLEEELGHLNKAEDFYRHALKQARTIQPEAREDVGAYLNALGTLLLRDRTEEAAAPAPPAPKEEKKKDDAEKKDEKKKDDAEKKKDDEARVLPAGPRERVTVIHPWSILVVSAVIAQQQDEKDDPKNDPKLKEVIELAHELINSADTKLKGQGHLMLGQAYVKQGERTEGLKEFSKGLKLLYPGMQMDELNKMIAEHPAFQQPDTANIANPEMAARYFGDGLHYYWSKQYPLAETEFKQAVRFDDQDARYQYFLGLAQWGQKTKVKRDAAIYSFEQGARLEAKGFPTVDRINQGLERIQGELRQQLNGYRYKAVVPAPAVN